MSELDGYLKAKHDVSNQLQLLSAYLEMGNLDRAQSIVSHWMEKVQSEQRFLMLPWHNIIAHVISYKIHHNVHIIFEVDDLNIKHNDADDIETEFMKRWDALPDGITTIVLRITEDETYINFYISIECDCADHLNEIWKKDSKVYTEWKIKK